MIPVHVIVTSNERAAAMWADSFTGAIDLYRFDSNVDAFQRLTGAQAPIDVLIVCPGQDELFNISADQLVQRLNGAPLVAHPMLERMQIVVVGQRLAFTHSPRVHAASTLEAAIKLVKYGEVEAAPAAAPAAPVAAAGMAPAAQTPSWRASDDGFAGSVISQIWDAVDAADRAARPTAAPATPAPTMRVDRGDGQQHVVGGGPRGRRGAAPRDAAQQASSTPHAVDVTVANARPAHATGSQLFAHASAPVAAPVAAPGFAVEPHAAAPAGPVAHLGMQGTHAIGGIEPARRYDGPTAEYRGPASNRASLHQVAEQATIGHGGVATAQHPAAQQVAAQHAQPTSMTPQLAQQVQQIVYPAQASADPLMGFSGSVQQQLMHQGQPVLQSIAQPAGQPVGYAQPASASHHATPAGAGTFQAAGSLLARAEADGAASFG